MIVELNIESSLANFSRRPVAVDLEMKMSHFTRQEDSMLFRETLKFTLSSFGDSRFQKLAWKLVKFCIKYDFHFSFPTRVPLYSELFWFYITHTGIDIDTGQDMTSFQDFLPRAESHPLSQCNPELVTEAM